MRLLLAAMLLLTFGHAGRALDNDLLGSDPFTTPKLDHNDFQACHDESLRTGKHVIAWSGYKCISSERQITNVIHCFVKEGDYSWSTKQAVYVLVPRNGRLWVQATIPASEVCALTIRQGCAGTYQSGQVTGAQMRAYGG